MSNDTPTSSWQTNRRYGWAARASGILTLVAHRGVYLLLSDKIVPIEAASLEAAIDKADSLAPPAGWSQVVGLWLSHGWKVQRDGEGWAIYDEHGTRMSKQVFDRADLARKWCEVRQDRVGINLRGPKPKEEATPSPGLPGPQS